MSISKRTYKRRNNGKPWSKSDTQKLLKLYSRNYDCDIARILGRTTQAIRSKGVKLGLKKDYDDEFMPDKPIERRRWTRREIRILKTMHSDNTFEDTSDKIDRTATAIAAKARQLKLRKIRVWTKREDGFLRRFHMKKSYLELAEILERTTKAIEKRTADLGLDRKFAWWTARELDMIIKKYPTMRTKELAKLVGRTAGQIRTKAHVLGVQKDAEIIFSSGRAWSKADMNEILRFYKNHTTAEVATMLGYPYQTIRKLLKRCSPGKLSLWTEKEDKMVRKYYKVMTYKELAAKLRHSVKSVSSRVETLGLVGRSVWTPKEIQKLKKRFNKGTPIEKIAALLGKSKNTCNYKITSLGLRKS